METIEPPARNAATPDGSGAIPASRLTSTAMESCSTAGIVDITAARSSLSDLAAEWVRVSRKISRGTLERMGVASGTTFFRDAGDKQQAIFFKYPDGWKARAFPEKFFTSSKGFKLAFWNIEQVIQANPKRVYITEGEFDALSLVESGVSPSSVLSVPNGARSQSAANVEDSKGYLFVREALAAGLNRAREIIWCGDSDGPGLVLRSDMARIFGAGKFHFVDWPDGAKDANDVLRTDGGKFLRELVEYGSLPWPVDGLFRMSELPEPAPLTVWNPGFAEWENKVRLAPRTMSVVTGHPGHGKTAMWSQIWFNVVRAYCVPMVVASFETRPKPHYRRNLRTFFSGKLEKEMTDEETRKADAWINERYLFAVHPEHRPALSWFLDLAEVAVVRHGARIIQVDPWNRMEAAREANESETEYIGRCLREIHAFAHDMNCHVQILAHPAKMDSRRRGDPPGLEDISGSKNWDNMVDQGFVVHRPEMFDGNERKTCADLLHRKARFEELGYPCRLAMDYDLKTGAYRSLDYKTGYGT
jgi:twinkle protein